MRKINYLGVLLAISVLMLTVATVQAQKEYVNIDAVQKAIQEKGAISNERY